MLGSALGVAALASATALGLTLIAAGWRERRRIERSLDDVAAFDGFLNEVAQGEPEERSVGRETDSYENAARLAEEVLKEAEHLAAMSRLLPMNPSLLDASGREIAQGVHPVVDIGAIGSEEFLSRNVFVAHYLGSRTAVHQAMKPKSVKARGKLFQATARRRRTPTPGSTG